MAIKIKEGMYQCGYCGKVFEEKKVAGRNHVSPWHLANECYEAHHLVFVPLSREDLKNLINFLYFKEDKYLSHSLTNTLLKYNKLRGEDDLS